MESTIAIVKKVVADLIGPAIGGLIYKLFSVHPVVVTAIASAASGLTELVIDSVIARISN